MASPTSAVWLDATWPAQTVPARGYRDPPPVTPFQTVSESELLRLRRYGAVGAGAPPVLLVSSLIKRPYVLDLTRDRSVVGTLANAGLCVYMTDWLPPLREHAQCGLDAYVNGELARAVDAIRERERVDRVAILGCCLGGLLALIYASLHPERTASLVALATPVTLRPPFTSDMIEAVVRVNGNVPAWWLHAGLNARVPAAFLLPYYLAEQLGEPELVAAGRHAALQAAFEPWLDSDVPVAGRLFCEVMRDAYGDAQLEQGRLRVGGKRVSLDRIRCPLLCISGEHDQLVPPRSTAPLVERFGGSATSLVFPAAHLGLMLSSAAHEELWPAVGAWLRTVGTAESVAS